MNDILSYLSNGVKELIKDLDYREDTLQEIRLRANKPIVLLANNKEYTSELQKTVTVKDLKETLELMGEYSLYSYEEQIKSGYITVQGGHRVGVVGKAVVENGKLKTIKNISGLNIRISHEIIGCSDKILPYIIKDKTIFNTLIISPPRCGKTTIIRDLARSLSNGNIKVPGMNVAIVDERSEIAACDNGIAQNDVGLRTDVLDACPKVEGMRMLLRSMSPSIIVVDEIGSREDANEIKDILSAGVKVICSIHASDLQDLKNRKYIADLIDEQYFEKLIFLSNKQGIGTLDSIWNAVTKRWDYRES